ncbi:MAG TPA: hypothetical protein VFT82_00710 [Candidatus Paceibacterota bacterium]|nr:hypothetical protein [Candidatus Paceibacterota bacterium]
MNPERINRKLVTFCAVCLLFLGSLFYLISVAWRSKVNLQAHENQTQDLINAL